MMICRWIAWQASSCLLPLFLHTVNDHKLKQGRLGNESSYVNFADSFQSDIFLSCSLSLLTVGEVQDVYGCALFSEYPVATILRDLSDVYAFEEGETPPTVAEQDLSMYALMFIGFSVGLSMCSILNICPCFD